MIPRILPGTKKNPIKPQKIQQNKESEDIFLKENLNKDDFARLMQLAEEGIDLDKKDSLLRKLLMAAHKEYGHPKDLTIIADYAKLVQDYKNECAKNPGHSFFIENIIKVIQLGADPNLIIRVGEKNKTKHYQGALGFILLYQPQAADILFEAGAKPLNAQSAIEINCYPYEPYASKYLTEWLFTTKTISPKAISILKHYKDDIFFESNITTENFADALNPTKPVGQVIWEPKGIMKCLFTEGTCGKIVKHLNKKYGISQQTIIAELAKQGIIIDRGGDWRKAIEIKQLPESENIQQCAKQPKIIEILPKAIPQPEKMTEVLLTSFADKDSVQCIKQFIDKAGIEKFDIYWQREKNIFMHCLVENGYIETVKKLILHDKNLLLAKDYDNKTQLIHTACRCGKEDIAAFLLQQGVDIQAKNRVGETALHLAALCGHITTVNLLLKHGADIHAKNNFASTALESLLFAGKNDVQYLNIIFLLIAYGAGADISQYKVSSMTPKYLKNIFAVAPLLRSALKTSPTDLNQLAKALLWEYCMKSGASNKTTAESFRNWISSNNPILSLLQSTAIKYAQIAGPSQTFEPLCRFIASPQFEYCLAPITNPVAHLKSILEEKDINIHLLTQVLNSLDKDSHYTMLLATWLYNLKDISDELVEILKYHKKKFDFNSITTAENYLHIIDPTTPIGRVLWAPRKDKLCSLYFGSCSDLVSHLLKHYRIDQQTIINSLAAINVKIDKQTGIYSLIEPIKSSSPRFLKAPVNTPNINEAFLRDLADTEEEKLLINEFINKNTTMKFASYWQLNKISFIDKVITTKDMMKLADKLFKCDPDLVNVTFGKDKHLMLHSAASTGNSPWLHFLLKNNIDINCKMKDGYTALHIAIKKGHTEIVNILLASGADVNAKNDSGKTPLELLIKNEIKFSDSYIFIKLIAYGADISRLETLLNNDTLENAPLPVKNAFALRHLLAKAQQLPPVDMKKLAKAPSAFQARIVELIKPEAPSNMLELTKALLNAYINEVTDTHKFTVEAQAFLTFIETGKWEFNFNDVIQIGKWELDFDDVKEVAAALLEQPFMKNSETFRELCEFICTKEFEYFLEPHNNQPGYNNTETAEQFYRNML